MARGRDGSTWVMQGAVIASILVHASFIAAAGLRREKPTEPIPEEPPVIRADGTCFTISEFV